jgi:hypothetical protein
MIHQSLLFYQLPVTLLRFRPIVFGKPLVFGDKRGGCGRCRLLTEK